MNARLIDFHGHAGSWPQYGMHDDADRMLKMMDLASVDRSCLFNVFDGDARRGNDRTAGIISHAPERFIGFAFVTPHYPEECRDELTRCFDELGFLAIKIYPPYTNYPVTHEVWAPVFEFADSRGLAVISHTWGGDSKCGPKLFAQAARHYPNVQWVLGHSGGAAVGRKEAVEAAQSVPSLYLEICSSYREIGSIEDMVDGVGADRVLFGSDIPLIEPRLHLARVLLADISDDEKWMILGRNAIKLLGLVE
ncbi:MAG: amidohydrolase family protein [Candidatus Latescibacteria bacterium]|nr:amidohydrolase family protein [Candidatus Latescibacterota bacterium]